MTVKSIILIAYLAALVGLTHVLRERGNVEPQVARISEIPRAIGDYVGYDQAIDPFALEVLGADETLFREYRRGDGRPMWIFVGYFSEPRENSQIHSPKHCYPGGGWNIYEESSMNLVFGQRRIAAQSLLITNGENQQVVFYWFQTDSGIVTNEFRLKWAQMKNALLRRSQRATFVRFSTMLGGDRVAAQMELRSFVELIAPFISDALNPGDKDT